MEPFALLSLVHNSCTARGEVDAVSLAQASGAPLAEVQAALERLEADGLILLEEYGFSCSVEYVVSGLTEAGLSKLNT